MQRKVLCENIDENPVNAPREPLNGTWEGKKGKIFF